ncbi:hypothetical protein CACET_c23770 [Clostridium aceticum]|uniref:Uncharacterized protein n=1 Tax=Clostridium aceticum TaxID=84022 RepID=A0A0D8I5D0_9CLOT|nr:hypothetical protein [Clostridium aceticum]AKL95823.1 hypothetical protein CACET_c23770 [Clostridium aceticum]KJF25443.1 hypothetical protein TZ02_18515 [Clostridium aceticum]
MNSKKGNKRKRIIVGTIIFFMLFGAYNLIWYQITYSKYDKFSKDMEPVFKGMLAQVYYSTSYHCREDGYQYSVKYPDYLFYTGNLAISNDDDTCSIIIWPSFFGNTKYGVMIQDEQDGYQIMVDENMEPIDKYFAPIIDKHKEVVKPLFDKANERWDTL